MRQRWLGLAMIVCMGAAGGCHKAPPSDKEAIRAGIRQHLSTNSTLNLAAMEYDIRRVSITGDRAQADVEFRLKQGGATMQVTYALARTDDVWRVLKSQPAGGQIEHPPMTDVHAGTSGAAPRKGVPTINDFFATPASAGTGVLPPGHPPASSSPPPPPAKNPPPAEKKY